MYEAVYDYDGEAEGDLSFKAGDLIQVRPFPRSYSVAHLHNLVAHFHNLVAHLHNLVAHLHNLVAHFLQVETHEGEWWTGVLNGERGIFPSNYVQTSSPTQSPTKYSQTSSPVHSPVGFVTSTSSEATNVIVHSKPLIARVIVGACVCVCLSVRVCVSVSLCVCVMMM